MPPDPTADWGERAIAQMDRAEAELQRVAAEVRQVPAMIANANRRLQRCLDEDRRLGQEREETTDVG